MKNSYIPKKVIESQDHAPPTQALEAFLEHMKAVTPVRSQKVESILAVLGGITLAITTIALVAIYAISLSDKAAYLAGLAIILLACHTSPASKQLLQGVLQRIRSRLP